MEPEDSLVRLTVGPASAAMDAESSLDRQGLVDEENQDEDSEWVQTQLQRLLARREVEAQRLAKWQRQMEAQRSRDAASIEAIMDRARKFDDSGVLSQRLMAEKTAFKGGLAEFHASRVSAADSGEREFSEPEQ